MAAESDAMAEVLTPDLLHELLEQGRIVLLLDDFDGLEPLQRVWVLQQLGALPARMVLASRIEPFNETVEATDRPLAHSVGIVLQPLSLDDLDGWLQLTRYAHRAPLAQSKWAPVFAECRQAPNDPRVRRLLTVLASPPMAAAAQALCSDGRTDPLNLLKKTSQAALEEPLVARLIRGLTPAAPLVSSRAWTLSAGQDWISDALHLLSRQRRLSGADMSLEGTGLSSRTFRVVLTSLSGLLTFLHFLTVLADSSSSSSAFNSYDRPDRSGEALIGMFFMTPVCVLLTYIMVSNPPVPASFPTSFSGAKRALISRQVAPAVICLAFVLLDSGWSAAWYVMAGLFLLRALCTPPARERPGVLRPTTSGYHLREELGPANVITADLMWTIGLVVAALFGTAFGGTTVESGIGVLDLPLRLTLITASAAGIRWLPHLLLDWYTFHSLPCALDYATHAGVLEKKESSYSFRHPAVADYFARPSRVSTRRPLIRMLRQPAAPHDHAPAFGTLDSPPPPPPPEQIPPEGSP
ncbi:hypothetical protein ACWGDE_30380 [Streptomyces sp. NPDC054956]